MALAVPVADATRQFLTQQRRLLIGGEWVDAADGGTFDSIDPGTGDVLATVAHGKAEDVDRAVQAARQALEGPWARMTPSERGRAIHRLGDLIAENADELAELDSLDNGKAKAVAAAADVPLAADLFWYMAGWATKLRGSTVTPSLPYLPGAEFHAYTLKEPVGVVGQIIPWNFPLLMAAWKVGPALATGCTIILKPAEQTPLSALRLGELALEAGIPPGVLNVDHGLRRRRRGARRARRRRQGRLHRQHRGRQADRAGRGPDEPQARLARARRQEPEHRARRRRRRGRDRRLRPGHLLQPGRGLHGGARLYIHENLFDEVVDGVSRARPRRSRSATA